MSLLGGYSFWIGMGLALLLALALQLLLLGFFLGRCDRQTLLLLQGAQQEWKRDLKSLRGRLEELEEEQTRTLQEVRRSLSRLELARLASPVATPGRLKGVDKKHHVVFLHRRGIAPEAISRKLKIYPGETHLVLSLNRWIHQLEKQDERAFV